MSGALAIMAVVAEVVGWLVFSYVVVSLVEWLIHRHLMHRKRLPKWVYRRSPYLLSVFEAHAVRHHHRYYAEFDYEPDPAGRDFNIDIKLGDTLAVLVAASPLFAVVFWISPLGGTIFFVISAAHNFAWNLVHREMHWAPHGPLASSSIFRALARQHLLHHRQVKTNYNVVLPLWDSIFGTQAKARPSALREMLRLGYLLPRHPVTQQRLVALRERVTQRREAAAVLARSAA